MSNKKNIKAHITEPVIIAIASGYTINTKPGPVSQKKLSKQYVNNLISRDLPSVPTSAILLFCTCAI